MCSKQLVFLFIQLLNIYINSLEVFCYRHFHFIKCEFLLFKTFYIKLLRFILPVHFPVLYCFDYCIRFSSVNVTPLFHTHFQMGIGPCPGFCHYSITAMNIVLHIFLLFFYRNVLAIVSPLLSHINFRIIFIKFCEGRKNPAVMFIGNPLKL